MHLVCILELRRGWPFKTRVCSAKSGLLSSYDRLLRNLNYLGRTIWTLLEVTREAKPPLLFVTVILGFLSNFTKSQGLSSSEALNSAHFSRCQRNLRPPLLKWWRPRAFSKVATGDSDIPSSCEMKDEPTFKPLQGNPAFFESGHLGVHSTVGRKHRVPLTYLLLRAGYSKLLVESWFTSSVKDGIIHISRRYGLHGTFLKLLY